MAGDRVPLSHPPTATAPPSARSPCTLRIQGEAPVVREPGVAVLVLDTTWLPGPDDTGIATHTVAGQVLAGLDPMEEACRRLDAWAAESGVIPALTVSGTSFWYYIRLVEAKWLQETLVWLAILERVLDDAQVEAIECTEGVHPSVVEAARLLAYARKIGITTSDEPGTPPPPKAPRNRRRRGRWAQLMDALPERFVSIRERIHDARLDLRRRLLAARLGRLSRGRRRPLLVLLQHAMQRVELPGGTRLMNVYLGPVVEQLRASRLDPVELQLRLSLTDPDAPSVTRGRALPKDVIDLGAEPGDEEAAMAAARSAAELVETVHVPLVVADVDLGPVLSARVARQIQRSFRRQVLALERIRNVLRRMRPAALLLAVEYNRPEWLAAARAEGVPVAAVQHGVIHDRHDGYVYPDPSPGLVLPDRTYVFGEWERRVLVDASAYRPDEVVVSGSPRLDLLPRTVADAGDLRTRLGVAAGDRLLVISGTWGSIYRRFYLPIALARILDRPLPGVHLVVKLHPGEPDEGPYRSLIERAAAVRGFAPPPVTVVQSIDLYQLLAAADAHIGVHSTVLTEAVVTGTLNLIVDVFSGADRLGYVDAGVAVPVRAAADVLDALDRRRELLPSREVRDAFLEEHFRSGNASGRIAADLLEWVP